jgi:RNA polymerase sigma-70 factor (ECF subfamily)
VRGIARFEGRSSLRSWVFSIVINRAKTRGVRDRRVVPSASLTGEPDDTGTAVDPARFQGPDGEYPGHWTSMGAPQRAAEPDVRALSSEALAMIERALDGLPERQRLVVQLRDVLGMSAEEVCATLQLTQQNQRVLLHRGRSALRAALEDYYRG